MTETDISAEIVFTLIATLHYSRYSFTKDDDVSSRRDVNM